MKHAKHTNLLVVATHMYFIKSYSEVFQKIHGKTLVQESLCNKDDGFS